MAAILGAPRSSPYQSGASHHSSNSLYSSNSLNSFRLSTTIWLRPTYDLVLPKRKPTHRSGRRPRNRSAFQSRYDHSGHSSLAARIADLENVRRSFQPARCRLFQMQTAFLAGPVRSIWRPQSVPGLQRNILPTNQRRTQPGHLRNLRRVFGFLPGPLYFSNLYFSFFTSLFSRASPASFFGRIF